VGSTTRKRPRHYFQGRNPEVVGEVIRQMKHLGVGTVLPVRTGRVSQRRLGPELCDIRQLNQERGKTAAALPPRSFIPMAVNITHITIPTPHPGTAVQYRAPARPSVPHQSMCRRKDVTWQPGEVYSVRLRPRSYGDDMKGAPLCVCRSNGRDCVQSLSFPSPFPSVSAVRFLVGDAYLRRYHCRFQKTKPKER
jgi:hypothetical protein